MLPDTLLGHYRILSPLGKGGMGEVYAAEDTKLHRTVALKVLPSVMASDPDRRKRFEREAQAVAALNHPNIVTIYSVEEASGVVFLTMEAVEGRTLKQMLAEGRMSLETLLRIATAVSDAMAAAHQRGITHRDLKPANVMVTPDGRVKVLDFGLAKLHEAEHESAADEPTKLRSDDLTGEGRIIGTVAYMSPEQAEGKPVDQRSDIFSLGVMLHEMAAGERPFKGDTDISVISAILKETPSSITDLDPALPTGLARIVRRCLSKDPARRYQTAIDVRNDLDELKQDLDSGIQTKSGVARAPRRAGVPMKWLAIGAALLLAVAAGIYLWTQKRPGAGTNTQAAVFTADQFVRLTQSGTANIASISPDGRYVVHVKVENGSPGLWVRQTAATSDVRVVAPAEVFYAGLAFSPDVNFVYYVTYPRLNASGMGTLYRIPALGGPPIRVLEDIDSGPSFSPDGRSFAFIRGDVPRGVRLLMVADVDGSDARTLAAPSGDLVFVNQREPAWSPDGRTILAIAVQRNRSPVVIAVDAANGQFKRIGEPWLFTQHLKWMPDGRSFIEDGVDRLSTTQPQLWQVSYPSGERRRVTSDLNGYTGVSLSADGRKLATVQTTVEARIWVASGSGEDAKPIALGSARAAGTTGVGWTMDGRLIFTAEAGGFTQLWIARADGTDVRQLTSGEGNASNPVASYDGRWIYYSVTTDAARIYRMAMDGSNPRLLTKDPVMGRAIVSRDSQWVYFTPQPERRPMRMKADGSEPTLLQDTDFTVTAVSPDGTQLMGTIWNQQKQRSECAIMPASGGTPRSLGDVATSPGSNIASCAWSPDGRDVTYVALRDGRVNAFAQPIGGGPERQVTRFPREAPPRAFAGAFSQDRRIAISLGTLTSDVVLIAAK